MCDPPWVCCCLYDVREKLVARGVPREEVAFIHEYNTETKKADLFAKVRAGQVRILMGSTPKLGAGTNIQDRLIALHHLDCPWKPSDLEQQEGRILRQGNRNKQVKIYRYVTENTFDSYMWQILENKQKFISQIMTSKSPVRACDDVDDTALSYAEIKALATGNPYIKEKMDLDIQVSKLKLLKANHTSQIYSLESDIARRYPREITAAKGQIEALKTDMEAAKLLLAQDKDHFAIRVLLYWMSPNGKQALLQYRFRNVKNLKIYLRQIYRDSLKTYNNRAMRLLREECRHEFWASYEPTSDNSGGKPENECWERCYPYSWKSGLYLRFAEERSEVYCDYSVHR